MKKGWSIKISGTGEVPTGRTCRSIIINGVEYLTEFPKGMLVGHFRLDMAPNEIVKIELANYPKEKWLRLKIVRLANYIRFKTSIWAYRFFRVRL